jgi:N-acetylmuramoyl-L-alanine amidase
MHQKRSLFLYLIVCFLTIAFISNTATAGTAKGKYYKAESAYKKLQQSKKKQKYREHWVNCIKKFKSVYLHAPSGPWAAAGLYRSGKLYFELYKRSGRISDKKKAINTFERIIKRFPKSRYKSKSKYRLKEIANFRTKNKTSRASNKSKKTKTKETALKYTPPKKSTKPLLVWNQLPTPTGDPSVVSGIRYWSNPTYTRVVIDASRETTFRHRLLNKDPAIEKPQRLFIDLKHSRLADSLQKTVPINDYLLMDARAGQHTSNLVRVVVDIKSFDRYKVFYLKNPFRIVIDVWGKKAVAARKSHGTPPSSSGKKLTAGALAKSLALGVSRIVIDAGHGGRDYGAPGYLKGVHEKDIALKIAKRLAKKIKEKLHCEVVLTRSTDTYLTLEERTAIANTKNADLFISIHTNSHRDQRAYGIETYFLNLATDDDAILVAARENATSAKNISDLQTILNDLMQNAKINESSRLAGYVQNTVCDNLKIKYSSIRNKGVKKAPFYVLLGAQMPAILFETSFISNARECKRLVNGTFQDAMAEAIVKGIKQYIRDTNPTALHRDIPKNGEKG